MEKTEIEKYNEWLTKNYEDLRVRLRKYCKFNGFQYLDDYLHNAIISINTAITNGKIMNYDNQDGLLGYHFLAYRRAALEEADKSYNTKRDRNYNSDNLSSLGNRHYYEMEDLDEKEDRFQRNFKRLVILEQLIYDKFGADYGIVFSKKMDGKSLDKTKRERKKLEEIKKWLRENNYLGLEKSERDELF